MKKLFPLFLAAFMLVTVLVPIAVFAAAPEFPDGSAISVKTGGSTVLVSYPNSALLDDDTIAPAYKVEVVAKDAENAVVSSAVYATEEALGADAATVIPRSFRLNGQRGNFTANVYPMSTADETTAEYGAPLSADFTVAEPKSASGAVRCEFEDYVSQDYAVYAEENAYASGGKFYTSHNGDSEWYAGVNHTTKENDLSITFDISLPADDSYTVDYVMGQNGDNAQTDVLELLIDGVALGTNNDTAYADISMGGTYPWQYIPMAQFRKSGVRLTAGAHTVTLKVNAPTAEDQPDHVFAADYVQFTPDTVPVADDAATIVEFENYTDKLITDDGTGENTTNAAVTYSANASGGAALHTDSYAAGDTGFDAIINIPVSVKTSGYYSMEYVASKAGSSTNVYIDNNDLAGYYADTNESTAYLRSGYGKSYENLGLDEKTIFSASASHWSYFWRAHHAAERHDSSLYLTAGEHVITLELIRRSGSNVAICMDYLKLSPASLDATISATETTILEMEDYTGNITSAGEPYTEATITENDASLQYASGGKLLNMGERQKLTDATITIPVSVEADGDYNVKWYVTNANNGDYLSLVTFKVDGEAYLINDQQSMAADLSHPDENGAATYAAQYYPMARYETRVSLTEGSHVITLEAAQINNTVNGGRGVKFYTDCIEIIPHIEKTVTVAGKTVIEAEEYVDGVYDGDSVFAGCSVTENTLSSGGKYMGASYGYADEASIPMKITVTAPGWYDVDALLSKKISNYVSAVELRLNDEMILENRVAYMAEDLSLGGTYISNYFPMHRFHGQVYLEEGSHVLSLYVYKTVGDSKVKFYADAITLTPAADQVIIAPTAAMVTAIFDEPATGAISFALYKEGRLLEISSSTASLGTFKASATIPFKTAPDTVKVFVWDSLSALKPAAEPKVLTSFQVKQPKLFLMGDSVCVSYGANNFWQQGWGHMIANHFTSEVMLSNNAVGGTSTKTFRTGGYWDGVYEALSIGDFVMINFGLNDFYDISETGKGTTIEEYQANLEAYCTAILEKGATPILISPMPECNTSHTSLIPRAQVMKDVANRFGLTFLDLNNTLNYQWILDENGNYDTEKAAETFDYYFMSEAAYNRLEAEYGTEIPQSQWDYISSVNDRTHINEDGAELVAQTIAELLAESDSPLKNYLK